MIKENDHHHHQQGRHPEVSIRPRPDDQGKHQLQAFLHMRLDVSIRPRPDDQGKRTMAGGGDVTFTFQSALDQMTKGNSRSGSFHRTGTGFNPPSTK
jgi:hypothetical protein